MNSATLNNKINKSFKWSFISQLLAKLVTPLSTMILARILVPEIFGITTAVTMVIAFCEIVADSGFAKYLIQHDFDSEDCYKKYFSVAFYASVAFSILISAVVIIFSKQISALISNTGYENVLIISTIQIPIFSIHSLFNAHLRRNFDFRKIFLSSLAAILTPFLITIPLAIFNFGYWSLVCGTTASIILQTVLLISFSKIKIKLFFSFECFKNMFAYSFSMIIEAIIIWACSWLPVFLIGLFYDTYYVGLFKVSLSTVTSVFGILSSTITSVLFPSFSRLKHMDFEFRKVFLDVQKITMFITIPLGIGCFLFSDLLTSILLGDLWVDASYGIGVISLSFIFKICYSYFLSEVFRSKGHYFHSIIFQTIMMFLELLLLLIMGRKDYNAFIFAYFVSNLLYAIVSYFYLILKFHFTFVELIKPSFVPIIASLFMCIFYFPCIFENGFVSEITVILAMIFAYFSFLYLFSRKDFYDIINFLKRRK